MILIIDDNETIRDGLAHTVKKLGHNAITCAGGAAGVEAFKVRRPDFVTYDGFTELIPPVTPGPDAEADAQALTQRVVSILERGIVAHPAQWYMFRPMWPVGGSQSGVRGSK